MTDKRPTDQSNHPPPEDIPGEDRFPVSSSASSLLRRLKPQPTPSAPAPEPPAPSASPFTTDRLDEVDLSEIDETITENAAEDPDTALIDIEAKMAALTRDLSEGRINQAQFQAIYTHYAEQKTLVLRLLAQDPNTKAWQRAASEGYTNILRKRHAAHLEGLLLLDNWTGEALRVIGRVDIPGEVVAPLLESLHDPDPDVQPHTKPLSTQIEGGRWLFYYRGVFTTALAVYSAEPSAVQITRMADAHAGFEESNHSLLELGYPDPDRLTYPQQALFQNEQP